MLLKDLSTKKILIWGYGLEGRSCLQFLRERGIKNKILVADATEISENIDDVEFIPESDILKRDFDTVIKSPGVSYYRNEIKTLQDRGVLITSTLNILLAEAQSIKNLKIIAITGTKGKSTSGSICCHILKSIGYKVALAGNIGISFLDCMDNLDKYDYLTLELSSYQITNMLYPVDYSIALNLFEEHLDWHHTHENYFRDKMNINNFSQNRIVNFEDDTIKKYIKVDMDYIYFNNVDGFHMAGDFICKENRQLFDTRKLRNIKGKHLFKNFNALFTVFDLENIDLNKVFLALNSFETLEHRLEIFHENKERNIVFVNDSISTIPETTIECLKTFENYDNVRLALGGFNRKQNYTDLISLINKNDKITAYLLGDTGKTLKERLNNSYFFDNFESLIREITKNIDSNTAIILSPASASYDMFKNFKERGGVFKEKVLAQLQGF